jgi:hypothetical protein
MATPKSKEPRRFAPLKEGADKTTEGVPVLKGVVFDVDGTLWLVWEFPSVWFSLCGRGFYHQVWVCRRS